MNKEYSWTPCSEKMPEEHGSHLTPDKSFSHDVLLTILDKDAGEPFIAMGYTEFGEWYATAIEGESGVLLDSNYYEPLAWCELPQPYNARTHKRDKVKKTTPNYGYLSAIELDNFICRLLGLPEKAHTYTESCAGYVVNLDDEKDPLRYWYYAIHYDAEKWQVIANSIHNDSRKLESHADRNKYILDELNAKLKLWGISD